MRTNRPLTVVSLLLSLSMAAMEMTVVSTAMPTVVGDLGGIHYYSWVFTAYLLTSTVTVPIYGKLADLYGRKPVLLAGIALFLVGSPRPHCSRSRSTRRSSTARIRSTFPEPDCSPSASPPCSSERTAGARA